MTASFLKEDQNTYKSKVKQNASSSDNTKNAKFQGKYQLPKWVNLLTPWCIQLVSNKLMYQCAGQKLANACTVYKKFKGTPDVKVSNVDSFSQHIFCSYKQIYKLPMCPTEISQRMHST